MSVGKSILIVEDDVKLSKMLRFLFMSKGFNVEIVTDGGAALDKISEETPDVIILDLMMPHMDGFEFCEKMHARGYLDKTPIIILSAYSYSKEVAKLLDLGVSDFLSKPFISSELLKKANNAISSKDC